MISSARAVRGSARGANGSFGVTGAEVCGVTPGDTDALACGDAPGAGDVPAAASGDVFGGDAFGAGAGSGTSSEGSCRFCTSKCRKAYSTSGDSSTSKRFGSAGAFAGLVASTSAARGTAA